MSDLQIVMAATGAEWAGRLAEWITDHGGEARLRDTYLFTRSDALEQQFDCLVAEADSSVMDSSVVAELQRRNATVVGVCDPDLPHTRTRLERLGVDRIVDASVSSQEMLEAILDVTTTRQHFDAVVDGITDLRLADTHGERSDNGQPTPCETVASCLTVVTGAIEGVGATEVAIEVSFQLRRRGEAVALVDADLVAPSLAQRLRAPLLPNLNTAVDAVVHRTGTVLDALSGTAGFDLLPGLEHPKNWSDLAPEDILDVLDEVRTVRPQVVVNVGSSLEVLPCGRNALARAAVACADRLIVLADPSPVGLQRLSRWLVEANELTESERVHVVFNRSRSREARRQVDRELHRICSVAAITHLPFDPRVPRAGWACEPVAAGPFTKAVAALTSPLPRTVPPAGRRRLRRRARP